MILAPAHSTLEPPKSLQNFQSPSNSKRPRESPRTLGYRKDEVPFQSRAAHCSRGRQGEQAGRWWYNQVFAKHCRFTLNRVLWWVYISPLWLWKLLTYKTTVEGPRGENWDIFIWHRNRRSRNSNKFDNRQAHKRSRPSRCRLLPPIQERHQHRASPWHTEERRYIAHGSNPHQQPDVSGIPVAKHIFPLDFFCSIGCKKSRRRLMLYWREEEPMDKH